MAPHPFGPSVQANASRRPLVISSRADVVDELVRVAAAAGVEVEVAPDLVAARGPWSRAPLVLLDDAVYVDAVARALPRRADVVLLRGPHEDPTVWQRAVRVGAEHVVHAPESESWLIEQLAEVRDGPQAPALVVGVVGGRGGAGATSLASSLAVTAVGRGGRVLLVDLDPLGGGIDLALGAEGASGLRWPDLAGARGRLNGSSLRDALPRVGELPILAWDRGTDAEVPYDAARAVLDAAARVCDVVIVDLPRGGGAAAAHVAGRAAEVLMVVPAEVRAVAAAERVLRIYRPISRSMRAVVRGPAPGGLAASAVGEALGLEIAAELRPEPRLAQSLDRGEPPSRRGRGPLAEFSASWLAAAGR